MRKSKKAAILYLGYSHPSHYFVGVCNQPNISKDKFGELTEGNVRACHIDTKWGQLQVPFHWMDKRIKIIVEDYGEY